MLDWRLVDALADAKQKLGCECSLLDLIALHHIRLDAFDDFLLALLVDLLVLADLAQIAVEGLFIDFAELRLLGRPCELLVFGAGRGDL